MRICNGCLLSKPEEEFHLTKTNKSGRTRQCKACINAKTAAYREANREKIREHDRARGSRPEKLEHGRAYAAANREVYRQAAKRWRAANPDKVKAHKKLNYEVRVGRVIPQPCARCGTSPAQAHHHDYSKPLDVTWLCETHHKEVHKAQRLSRT